ncbi:hypothetical protein HR060_02885 [Catenovulum sp. SM1970]|uniref:hypothetical protein n=1 Tax=Marinifaba aquimaris TaxID=2741323 RepID=UPI001572C24D|nr:hypothetical protein [Marinifaba aquimaris]NTS75801.1 hypothetical protein [Marinifaba aquimaris]
MKLSFKPIIYLLSIVSSGAIATDKKEQQAISADFLFYLAEMSEVDGELISPVDLLVEENETVSNKKSIEMKAKAMEIQELTTQVEEGNSEN